MDLLVGLYKIALQYLGAPRSLQNFPGDNYLENNINGNVWGRQYNSVSLYLYLLMHSVILCI